MTHGSLFSGIGGFDLAAEWMGWENIFSCEINPFGQRLLKYYWPNVTHHEDITKTDFTIYRGRVDIITGGFPCQPFSSAGKRKGKADERHLWPQMLRAIREIQPRWVVGENVPGIINWDRGLVFDEVQSDLASAGYEIIPFILPAAAVNAPHRRDRVWFVAHSINGGYRAERGEDGKENCISEEHRETLHSRVPDGTGAGGKNDAPEDSLSDGRIQRESGKARAKIRRQRDTGTGGGVGVHLQERTSADTSAEGLEHPGDTRELGEEASVSGREGSEPATASEHDGKHGNASDTQSIGSTFGKLDKSETREQIQTRGDSDGHADMGDATDTSGVRLRGDGSGEEPLNETSGTWDGMGKENAPNSEGSGSEGELQQRQGEGKPGGRNSERTATDTHSRRQSSEEHREAESEWLAENGLSGVWEDFPTQSPLCGRDDGISSRLDNITFPKWRNESIKAYGNAIVPQVVFRIFKAIEKYEREYLNK